MRNISIAAFGFVAALSWSFGQAAQAQEAPPAPVSVARATAIPICNLFVDAAAFGGDGALASPFSSIGLAVEAAQAGAVVCVAEGIYAEGLLPGEKHFTLAGGFQSGSAFKVRDSAAYPSVLQGKGGSFLRIQDPGPVGGLTAIDGFEITGYSQAIVRDFYESQRFEVTNNFIHHNVCGDASLAGAGVALVNVSGSIKGNVFADNSCGRGGAIFLNDTKNENSVLIERNLIQRNSGTEAGAAHGGAVYVFGNSLTIAGNAFIENRVNQWGGGLYVGAYTPGNQPTTAKLAWNLYRGNRAGDGGGGFFCDDGATCLSEHEIYDRNCGGNILVDGGSEGSGPTTAKFDHLTNYRGLDAQCQAPGSGLVIDTYDGFAPDSYAVTNAIFFGNAPDGDLATGCGRGCDAITMTVSHSMLRTKFQDGSIAIRFGEGIVPPEDPQFVAPESGNFRLKPGSPAIGKGTPQGADLGAAPRQ